ncbi:MAG TPA: ice-binding family protein [Polyangiaceae bacterium]|nr:ice-binding family protein [Polyangiaceae bacterium]
MKAFPSAALLALTSLLSISCGGEALTSLESDDTPAASSDATPPIANAQAHATASGANAEPSVYRGPSVGAARGFSALAHTSISAINGATVTGNLGVSGAKVQAIVGFDPPAYSFGTDSTPPNSLRTVLTQQEISGLVGELRARECDAPYPAPASAASGVTLHPGVTCLNDSDSEQLLSGRVILDAGGDPNAFFVVRSHSTLTVADATQVVLANGAQACGVFWQADKGVSIGARVEFAGTVIAATGISLQSGSKLVGRLLAQSEAVSLDGNTIIIPTFDENGGALKCSHEQ